MQEHEVQEGNEVIFDADDAVKPDVSKPVKNKKKKRTANLKELRQMISPEKDFEFENPEDEDDIIVITARKLSPGHIMKIKDTAFIKAYQKRQIENELKSDTEKAMDDAQSAAQKAIKRFLSEENDENLELMNKANEAVQIAKQAFIDSLSEDELDKYLIDTHTDTLENLEFSAIVASVAIIDKKTKQNVFTQEEVMLWMMPAWHMAISSWAIGGASPQDEENPDEIDDFPANTNG